MKQGGARWEPRDLMCRGRGGDTWGWRELTTGCCWSFVACDPGGGGGLPPLGLLLCMTWRCSRQGSHRPTEVSVEELQQLWSAALPPLNVPSTWLSFFTSPPISVPHSGERRNCLSGFGAAALEKPGHCPPHAYVPAARASVSSAVITDDTSNTHIITGNFSC